MMVAAKSLILVRFCRKNLHGKGIADIAGCTRDFRSLVLGRMFFFFFSCPVYTEDTAWICMFIILCLSSLRFFMATETWRKMKLDQNYHWQCFRYTVKTHWHETMVVVAHLFYFQPWGDDPIWRAYFSDGWLNHQLDWKPCPWHGVWHSPKCQKQKMLERRFEIDKIWGVKKVMRCKKIK